MKIIDAIVNIIRRGRVSLIKPVTGQFPLTQVSYNGRVIDVHVVQPYGIYSIAPLDSIALMFNVMAQEENKAAIIQNYVKHFYSGLKSKEVKIGNPFSGANIFFDDDGNVEKVIIGNHTITVGGDQSITVTGIYSKTAAIINMTSTGNITLTAPTVKITGNLEVDGSITDDAGGASPKTMSDMRDTYNIHTHDETGTVTDVPNQTI